MLHRATWKHHRQQWTQQRGIRNMWRPCTRQESRRPFPKTREITQSRAGTRRTPDKSSMPTNLRNPPSWGRIRCLKSRDQREAQPHNVRYSGVHGKNVQYSTRKECPVQWSTRKDAQDARETVKIKLPREQTVRLTWVAPTQKANAGLPEEQPVYLTVHLTWEVQTVRTTHNVNIKLLTEQQIKLSHGTANRAVERTASQAAGGTASSSQVGAANPRTETRVGVQVTIWPRAVPVGTANGNKYQAANLKHKAANETQSVNNTQSIVVQVGTETSAIQLRAVHGGTAVLETRLRTSDQDRSQAKRDMADVAVVEHPHEDEEHEKWDQLDKVNWVKRTNELGSVGGPENKRSWIRGRSEQRLNVQSCEKSVLINCATVRRREKWSRHDGVNEGDVIVQPT